MVTCHVVNMPERRGGQLFKGSGSCLSALLICYTTMVSTSMGSPEVCNRKLTTAVPATQTGENKVSELTDMDLAMKLHYIEGVYFFTSEAAEGLRPEDLKGALFHCLSRFFTASGRVRRSETGRPFIKCNDSGIRIVEADCDQTIEQVLATKDHSFHSSLAYTQHLGPDLGFSPLVIIQVLLSFSPSVFSIFLFHNYSRNDYMKKVNIIFFKSTFYFFHSISIIMYEREVRAS